MLQRTDTRKPPRKKLRALAGATITRIHRHGKYLLIETDTVQTLLVHLGMTGRTLIVGKDHPPAKHTHVVVDLGDRELRFVDPRRFGQIDVVERGKERDHEGLAVLGAHTAGGRQTILRSSARANRPFGTIVRAWNKSKPRPRLS